MTMPAGNMPLSTRIARGIATDVRRGRLRPGTRLPGSRRLAEAFGVHRNTVLAALTSLDAEGWLRVVPAQGTFIADVPPIDAPLTYGVGPTQGRPIAIPPPPDAVVRPPPPSDAVALLGGLPDLSMAPTAVLARAWRRAIQRGTNLLGYGDPQGEPATRDALAQMLREVRGLSCGADDLLITRGAQMALYLLARAVLRPGERVAVEGLGYRPAWVALKSTGACMVPIAIDAHGLDIEALKAAHAQAPLRAVYLTPHHQYPTMVTLSAGRRLALLAWAAAEGVLIIEDDYDNEFHYESRPVLPLAHADRAGVVVYIGTLSKVFAPSIRMGYVAGPPQIIEAMTRWRAIIDRQGDRIGEWAVAELLGDGELPRHVRRMKRCYRARRDAMVDALQNYLPRVAFEVPPGGMAVWCRLPAQASGQHWARAAARQKVIVQAGADFAFDGLDVPGIRVGFAGHAEPVLMAAIRRWAAGLETA